jgi:hypothetical protein
MAVTGLSTKDLILETFRFVIHKSKACILQSINIVTAELSCSPLNLNKTLIEYLLYW